MVAPPPSLDVGAPSIQYIAFNTYYLCKQKHRFILTNAYKSIFYSINTTYKPDRLKHSLCFKLGKWLFPSFQKCKLFCHLSHNVLALSLSIDIIARFVSFLSVTVDLWNVLISLNLLKLYSAVLRTAVIGKLSLGRQWKGPQAPFPLASAEIFPVGEQHWHFAYAFQVSVDAMQTDVHKALYPFYTKRNCSILRRPITSLGHQKGRRVFREGPNFLNYTMSSIFELCLTHFSRGGLRLPCAPPWLRDWFYGNSHKKCTSLVAIARHFEISYTKSTICRFFIQGTSLQRSKLPWCTKLQLCLLFTQQDFPASFRKNGCKRLRSRPKQSNTLSRNPCLSLLTFSRWTLIHIIRTSVQSHTNNGIFEFIMLLFTQ